MCTNNSDMFASNCKPRLSNRFTSCIARFSTMCTLPKSSKSNVYNSSTCYYANGDQVKSREKITEFQKRVYEVTRLVPKGYITTYGAIAKHLNCKSAQAVGQALKKNPNSLNHTQDVSIMVPCHRVVAGNLHIGGFSGHRQGPTIERKIKFLKNEGVNFIEKSSKDKKKLVYCLDHNQHHLVIKKFKRVRCKVSP